MSTTTATTGPPLTLEAAVRQRIAELDALDVRTFTLTDFQDTAEHAHRPLSWLEDHLDVLAGIGILTLATANGMRAWTVAGR